MSVDIVLRYKVRWALQRRVRLVLGVLGVVPVIVRAQRRMLHPLTASVDW